MKFRENRSRVNTLRYSKFALRLDNCLFLSVDQHFQNWKCSELISSSALTGESSWVADRMVWVEGINISIKSQYKERYSVTFCISFAQYCIK